MSREELLQQAAVLFQAIEDKDALSDDDIKSIRQWLAAWETERQRLGQPAWLNPPTWGTISTTRADDVEIDE